MADTKVFLSGGRIQGRSDDGTTANRTPLHDIDFTEYANQSAGEAAWVSASTSGSNGYMVYDHTNKNLDCRNQGNSAGAKICYYDLGASVNATDWRLRFRINNSSFSTETTLGKSYYTGFSISNAYDTADTGSPDWFGVKFIADAGSAQSQFYGTDGGSQSGTTMSFSPTSNSGVNDIFVEWHFVSGTCTCKFFTDSNYDTQISGTATVSKSTSVAGLRYFMVYLRQDNGGNGDNEFVVDDFEFINGTESTDEKATLIPTVFEQSDGQGGITFAGAGTRQQLTQQFNAGHALIGETISKCSFFVSKSSGTPTGTLVAYLKNKSTSSGSSGTITAISTSLNSFTAGDVDAAAEYAFTFTPHTIVAGDMVVVGNPSGGNDSNMLNCVTGSGTMTNGICYKVESGESYVEVSGEKLKITIAPDVKIPENTLFEETDTRETYWLQDNTGISKAGCLGYWKFQEQSGNVINHATTAN